MKMKISIPQHRHTTRLLQYLKSYSGVGKYVHDMCGLLTVLIYRETVNYIQVEKGTTRKLNQERSDFIINKTGSNMNIRSEGNATENGNDHHQASAGNSGARHIITKLNF